MEITKSRSKDRKKEEERNKIGKEKRKKKDKNVIKFHQAEVLPSGDMKFTFNSVIIFFL